MTSARQRQDRSIVRHITLFFDGFSFPRLLISFLPFNPTSAPGSVYFFRYFYLKRGNKPRRRSRLVKQPAGHHPAGLKESSSDKRLSLPAGRGGGYPTRGVPLHLRYLVWGVRPAGEGRGGGGSPGSRDIIE